jgi:hypothetical protein
MSFDTNNVSAAVSAVLLEPKNDGAASLETQAAENTLLKMQVETLRREVGYYKEQISTERTWPKRLQAALNKLYGDIRNESAPDTLDQDAAWSRIVELVTEDMEINEDLWSPEQTFEVTVRMSVKVRGEVMAATREQAEKRLEESLGIDLEISSYSGFDNADIWDQEVDDIDVD